MTTATTSKQFTLNLRDGLRGLLLAVITSTLAIIYEAIIKGGFTSINWELVGTTAAISGIGYITKNFLTPSTIVVQDPPKQAVEAVKEGKADVIITAQEQSVVPGGAIISQKKP